MALKMFASFRGYVLASLLLTTCVISHAVYVKRFFYRSVIYLSESKLAIMAVGNMGLVTVLLLWRLIQVIFLGPLRFREVERLHIRARDAVIECCFAISVFRNDFDLKFVVLVMTLLLLKSLHWLSKDRIELLEEQPLSPWKTHLRLVGLMTCLLMLDFYLVRRFAILTYNAQGATVFVLFAFEFTVLIIELCSDIMRYIFLVIDTSVDGHWEGKGMFSFYIELLSDLCQLTVYVLFFIYVQLYYTFPYHIIRELYVTFHKFQRRCSDFLRYRRVVATMNDLFADATEEELAAGDRTCIICREEMQTGKKLACGHIFHARCLQSWLKRQLTCPTCRANIDVNGNGNQSSSPRNNAGEQPQNNQPFPNQANNNANQNLNNNNPNAAIPNNGAPVPPNAQRQRVGNNGEAGARLLNLANQWLNQVLTEAGLAGGAGPGAGRANGGVGMPRHGGNQANAPPRAGTRRHPGQNQGIAANVFLRGPNAAAHMELRARRRGAWPQPYQRHGQNQAQNNVQGNQTRTQQQYNFNDQQPRPFLPYGMNPLMPPAQANQHIPPNMGQAPHVTQPPAGRNQTTSTTTETNQNSRPQNTHNAQSQGAGMQHMNFPQNLNMQQLAQVWQGGILTPDAFLNARPTANAPPANTLSANVPSASVPSTGGASQGDQSQGDQSQGDQNQGDQNPQSDATTEISHAGGSSSTTAQNGQDNNVAPGSSEAPPQERTTETIAAPTQQPASSPRPSMARGAGQIQAQTIPLERLLAIQEQIEVLRNEVMELVLMATSTPVNDAVPSVPPQATSERIDEEIGTPAVPESDDKTQETGEGAIQEHRENIEREREEDENSEAAELRRRRVAFLERNSRR